MGFRIWIRTGWHVYRCEYGGRARPEDLHPLRRAIAWGHTLHALVMLFDLASEPRFAVLFCRSFRRWVRRLGRAG